MSSPYTKIESADQLRLSVLNGKDEYFIWLGGFRSSKNILIDGDHFQILNEIDDTEDIFTEEEMMASNVGTAIKNGKFYAY